MGSCNAVMVFYIEGYIIYIFLLLPVRALIFHDLTFYPVECGNIY